MKKNDDRKRNDSLEKNLVEKVIKINRVNKVVKGGKRLAFRAFVITGDQNGKVGFGLGKSKEVPVSIKKAMEKSKKQMVQIETLNGTLPHIVKGEFGSAKVIIKPAPDGTGVIAGGAMRILLESLGLRNVVAKSLGSSNVVNVVKATMDALEKCRNLKNEEILRGKKLPVFIRNQNDVEVNNQTVIESKETKSVIRKKKDKTNIQSNKQKVLS